jgi:flagellar motor protein MotB
MKHLLILISILLLSSPVIGQSERPETIIVPVSSMGDVSDTRKQILENTLTDELKKHFRIVPQEKYEQVLEQVFAELEYEECSEDTCIMRVQEMLQVENVFNLQIIGEGKDSQLNLKWITLDEKKNEEDYCEGCGTRDLRKMIGGLVEKLVVGKNVEPVVSIRSNDSELKKKQSEELKKKQSEELKKKKEEELKKKQAEELKKKQSEELKKKQAEELKKKKEEELKEKQSEELKRQEEDPLWKIKDDQRIKIENEKRIKERQTNYSFTFRSIGIINSFEYKILETGAVGILFENSSSSNVNETIKESSVTTAIFALHGLNECYYCDTDVFGGVYGEGNMLSTTDQGSEYKYKFQYLYLLYGYQWYWNTDISLALLGGLVYRNKSKVSETVVNNEVFSESDVQLTKGGIGFYPAILVGYSF